MWWCTIKFKSWTYFYTYIDGWISQQSKSSWSRSPPRFTSAQFTFPAGSPCLAAHLLTNRLWLLAALFWAKGSCWRQCPWSDETYIIPGVRAGHAETILKLLAKDKCKYSTNVTQVVRTPDYPNSRLKMNWYKMNGIVTRCVHTVHMHVTRAVPFVGPQTHKHGRGGYFGNAIGY